MENFDSPLLADVAFNEDGSLKQSGKQVAKFYREKRLCFRGKVKLDAEGKPLLDEKTGKQIPIIDPKTGLPYKEAYEALSVKINIQTKGDTNIIDDIANDFHKRQFYRQYKYFMEGRIPDGVPIEDFDFFQPGTVMELHMLGVHVIQQVATMDDVACEQLKDQPGYEIRDIAAQWVRINSPHGQSTKATKLELENASLKAQLAEAQKAQRKASFTPAAVEEVIEDEPIRTKEVDLKDKKRIV